MQHIVTGVAAAWDGVLHFLTAAINHLQEITPTGLIAMTQKGDESIGKKLGNMGIIIILNLITGAGGALAVLMVHDAVQEHRIKALERTMENNQGLMYRHLEDPNRHFNQYGITPYGEKR